MVLPIVDLFAGCGGLTAGFTAQGGFGPVAGCELDLAAAATYAANFGDHLHVGDIRDWAEAAMPSAAVVIGGPPCQGFSALGRRDPADARNALWAEYLRVLLAVQPQYFVLENVPQFLQSQQFADLVAETARGGRLHAWELESFVLNAADYGAPQARRRAIVIGRPRASPELGRPAATGSRATVRDALRDVDPVVTRVDLPESWTSFRGTRLPGVFKMRDIHVGRRPTENSLARYRAIPAGGNRFNLPERLKTPGWQRHTSGSGDVMGRLVWDKPSVTIRTEFFKPEKGRYLHPEQHRALTHLEAALLQGFPENFLWCGSKVAIAKQIGNAVPVALGVAIAAHLARALGA